MTFCGFQNQGWDPQQQLWQYHRSLIVLWGTLGEPRDFVNTFWLFVDVYSLEFLFTISEILLIYK